MAREDEFDNLIGQQPFKSDLAFSLNGLTAEEYIAKVTDEINQIDLASVPIDRWDFQVVFMLALLEVAGDFFIGDPGFKYSLAKANGPFCMWLAKLHKLGDSHKWWGHAGSAIDCQTAELHVSVGEHRAKTFAHDLPLLRFLFGAKVKEEDSSAEKTTKHVYNGALIAHDLLCFSLALYSLCTGKFVDCVFTKEGVYEWIVKSETRGGNSYESYNLFLGVVKYLVHMLADFCSSRSLPIPGWSLLTHFPDRDVEAFALKLYKNGMNLRTLALQGVPVGVTELLMSVYLWVRRKADEGEYSDEAWEHKKRKLLLIAHGITSAVNVGKVIITGKPWRLNLAVIGRTIQVLWKVLVEELKLTNNHILSLDLQLFRERIASAKTLVLYDELLYETDRLDQLSDMMRERVEASVKMRREALAEVDADVAKLDAFLED